MVTIIEVDRIQIHKLFNNKQDLVLTKMVWKEVLITADRILTDRKY